MDAPVATVTAPIQYLGPNGHFAIGALIVFMFIALIGVIWLAYTHTIEKKDGTVKKSKIRRRAIQFLSVALGLPVILILALVGALGTEAIATLFGTFFGYVLSGLGDEEK